MNQNIQKNPKNHSIWLEFVIFLLFLLGPLTGNIINVLFEVLSTSFHVSLDHILIAIPAFMFPFAITQLFSGAISDIKGRIPVLIVGLILFGIAMLIAALSINLEMYVIANIIGGLGFGFINPVLIALMTDITPPPNLAKKLGYLSASANLGVGLGPWMASYMILIGWQSIYILFIIITCFGLIYFIIAKRPSQKISTDARISSFFKQISTEWRRLVVILLILSAFFIAHTYIAINIWTSRTLSHVFNETLIGLILLFAGVGAAITGVITGFLIKTKGAKLPLIFGSVILLCSLFILLIIGDITIPERFVYLALGWILAGLSGGILFTTITYYSQVISPKRRGVLAGSLTASYFTGIALVPITLAPFYDNFGIIGVYIAILVASILFIVITFLLYLYSNRNV
ncbi:MAG: MFS transporter [Candidatus Lokiarchaeia archaeon]|nr:MFS transporter [Candidatus Lokiarchaeia archaeon]